MGEFPDFLLKSEAVDEVFFQVGMERRLQHLHV